MDERLQLSAKGLRGPRYWPTWLLWSAMRLTHRLPLRWHRRIGSILGTVLRCVFVKQRHVANINLALCFPHLDDAQRKQLLRAQFASLGMSFSEMGIAWFSPIERIRALIEVHGMENLRRALDSGRPVLLWAAHFSCIEVGVRILQDLVPRCAAMHNTAENPLLDAMHIAGRSRFADELIPRNGIRRLLSRLKDGYTVVYVPDQTHVGNQSEMLPFFGVPAATNTATSKLATRANAHVLTYFCRRLPNDAGYRVDIGPPLPGIPSADSIDDTRRLFAALEDYIRIAPEQYIWTYKKFKRRPAPYPDPYARSTEP